MNLPNRLRDSGRSPRVNCVAWEFIFGTSYEPNCLALVKEVGQIPGVLKTARSEGRSLLASEVHADGHFRRRPYPLKMLLRGDLVGEKIILPDCQTASARFFLFQEGKIG